MPSSKAVLRLKSQLAAPGQVPFNPALFKVERGSKFRIYVRVSTKREEMISPEKQIEHCRRKGRELGLVEYGEPIVDLGLSGSDFTKRKVGEMISEVEEGLYQNIIVWKVSRWGRNMLDSLLNIRELGKVKGGFHSATEDLDDIDTPSGKMTLGMLLMVAEFQLGQIKEGWIDAHETRAAKQLPHSGGERYGYLYGRSAISTQGGPDDGFRGYIVDENLRPVVLRMYTDYVNGKSFRSIAAWLNREGYARKAPWTYTTVRQVLDAGFAAGLFRYRNEQLPGLHEQIISDDLWEKYVLQRQPQVDEDRLHPRTLGQSAVLKRFVYCALCERRMALCQRKQTKNGKVYTYATWKCAGQKGCAPGGHSITNEILMDLVQAWLQEHATTEVDTSEAVARRARNRAAGKDASKVEKRIKQCKGKLGGLIDMKAAGELEKEEYDEKRAEYLKELDGLETELATLRQEEEVTAMPSANVFAALYAAWNLMDKDRMNASLAHVLGLILVSPGPSGSRRGKISREQSEARVQIVSRFERAEQEASQAA